jgi:hypothetical protein
MTMEEYIASHYVAGIDKVGIELPMRVIKNPRLNIIMIVLTWILGLASLY